MPWQPSSFVPEGPVAPQPWAPSTFVPDNPHESGQEAAQTANVKPVAAPAPYIPKTSVAGTRAEVQAVTGWKPSAPSAPASEEPDLSQQGIVGIGLHGAQPFNDPANPSIRGLDEPKNIAAEIGTAQQAHRDKVAAVSKALGGQKFDTAQGVSQFWDALRVAGTDNPVDRVKYLNKNGYTAKVVEVPGIGSMTVFKTPGEDTWHPVNGEDWSMGDAGRAVAALPSIGTQIGTTVATDGAPILLRLAAQGATGAGEKLLEEGVNKLAGTNSGSIGENLSNAAGAGGRSVLGELVGSAMGAGGNLAKGTPGGMYARTKEGQDVIDAATRLGLGPKDAGGVTPGVANPALRMREQQIAPLANIIQDHYASFKDNINNILVKAGNALTGGATPAITDQAQAPGANTLGDVMAAMRSAAAAPVNAAITPVETSQAGRTAANALTNTVRPAIAAKTNAAYQDVLDPAHEGVFDLSPIAAKFKELGEGVKYQGIPAEDGTVPQQQYGGLVGAFQGEKKMIESANPTLGTEEMSGTSAAAPLQAVRSKVAAYAGNYPQDAKGMAAYTQANKLLPAIDETVANPVSGNPALANKVQNARNASQFQNRVLDAPIMQDVKNISTGKMAPEDLMAKYAKAGNYSQTQLLNRVMPPEVMAQAKDAFATQLMRQPEKIGEILKSFDKDPRELKQWLTPENRKLLVDYSSTWEKLNSSPVAKMMAEKNFANRPAIALSSEDAPAVADLIQRAGGQDSPIGLNLRAAVFNNISQASQKMGKTDVSKMASMLDATLSNPSTAHILSPEEIAQLTDVRDVANAQAKVMAGSMQGGMHSGASVKGVGGVVQWAVGARDAFKSAAERLEARIQGYGWTSPLGRAMLMGGTKMVNGQLVAPARAGIAARMAGAMATQYQSQAPNSEYNQTIGSGTKEPGFFTPGKSRSGY